MKPQLSKENILKVLTYRLTRKYDKVLTKEKAMPEGYVIGYGATIKDVAWGSV